jgi:NAD(P)-dependent dehydrogenase (short-subunit alcohol dehydrogenase family)
MDASRSMTDTICIVTGANSGIGKATAEGLARRGAHVAMVCRSPKRGTAALAEIRTETGSDAVELHIADLAVQASIRQLAFELRARYDRIDVLVNNAGIYQSDRVLTPDGIEQTFAVNHLAYFLLTHLASDLLGAAVEARGAARVVNVSSEAHRQGRIHFDDPSLGEGYSGLKAYSQSKLANVLFTRELARRLQGTGVTANAVHPGVVNTGIWSGNNDWLAWAAGLFSPFYKSPASGAKGPLKLATDPDLADVSGAYFDETTRKQPAPAAQDDATARRLWRLSAEMTGLPDMAPIG